MQKLIEGIHNFQENVFGSQKALFERLAAGQQPDTLFITCADSRINPNLITQTDPGELFILRNAGNIVPPYSAVFGGEAATIEYAVVALGIKDIIVCGHSHCGAMKGLLDVAALVDLPAVAAWLYHAEATWSAIIDKYQGLPRDALIEVATEENVLIQLENLRTHPTVAAALDAGKLKLHGWVYTIESGAIHAYDPAPGQFAPLAGKGLRPSQPDINLDEHAI